MVGTYLLQCFPIVRLYCRTSAWRRRREVPRSAGNVASCSGDTPLMRCGSAREGATTRCRPATTSLSACLPFPRPRHFIGYAPSSYTAGLTVTAPFAAFLQPSPLARGLAIMGPSYPELRAGASHGQVPCRPIGRPPTAVINAGLASSAQTGSTRSTTASSAAFAASRIRARQPVRPDRPERPRSRCSSKRPRVGRLSPLSSPTKPISGVSSMSWTRTTSPPCST